MDKFLYLEHEQHLTDKELQAGLILEWNARCNVGDGVQYTDDHGRSWHPSTSASRAFLHHGVACVRVRGAKEPVRLLDVVPEQL